MVDDARARPAPRIVGRSEELDRIDDMVERLATGRGGVVVLTGPPGIGLTTLLHEAISRAGEAVADVRAVHVPSGLLDGDAAALAAVASGSAAEPVRRAASAAAAATAATAAAPAAEPTRDTTAAFLDDPDLLHVAVEALGALSAERPLLVTVDDVPVADHSLFAALTSLAAGIAVMPVLVVATSHVLPRSRYEDSPVGPLWVRRLAPLTSADAVALVRDTAGLRVPRSVAAAVGRGTGGVPGDLLAVCARLEPDQLVGADPLPDPLPGTPVTTATYRPWWESLPPRARRAVLCTAVAVTAGRSEIEEAAGASVADVVGPDGEPALREATGRVTSKDPRLLSAACALSRPEELEAARSALAGASPEDSFERRREVLRAGGAVSADALGALAAAAGTVLDRGRFAAVSSIVGEAARAMAPATPPAELLLLGGVAALYQGHAGRAVTLLGRAVGEAPGSLGRFFPALLIAASHRDRTVPHHLVSSCLSRLGQEEHRESVRVAALAARLCAEYGDVSAARRYLGHAEELVMLLPDPGPELAAASDPGPEHAAPPEPSPELAADLGLARAMVDERPSDPGHRDALAALAVGGRSGLDVAGWQLEMAELTQLIRSRSWARARVAVSDLGPRLQRFPAPLLRAQLATLSVRLHLAVGEYARADEAAASAVAEGLPLHVPLGGAGTALLAQVAFLRGRRSEAESWLEDLAELVRGSQDVPLHAAALHETLGLRANLDGDVAEAVEHCTRAVAEGAHLVSPSTLLDLVHLRWRTAPGTPADLDVPLPAAGDAGAMALSLALALVRAPDEAVVETVASTVRTARTAVPAVHEAQLLELAAGRLATLAPEEYALQSRSSASLPAEPDTYRAQLLRRAGQLYRECGADARAAVTDQDLTALERRAGSATDLRSLTPEELAVARLVHRGSSNKEVAGALYISVRTVELRLTHVYRKLGVRSRRELRELRGLTAEEPVP